MRLVDLSAMALHHKREVDAAGELLIGRFVRVTSDYNDQPFGSSRPSLKGQEFEISGVYTDGAEAYLWLRGQTCSINVDEVELLP